MRCTLAAMKIYDQRPGFFHLDDAGLMPCIVGSLSKEERESSLGWIVGSVSAEKKDNGGPQQRSKDW